MRKSMLPTLLCLGLLCLGGVALPFSTASGAEGPALDVDLTQEQIASRERPLIEIRSAGRQVFSAPFNELDGLGDGPMDPSDPTRPGGRPTLQNNGLFLRFNGLDSQTCLECHGILSNARIPATFGVGGVGGIGANAFPGVVDPDLDDSERNGFAAIGGRMINPPFAFGSGGIELLGKEMTADLQRSKSHALARPGKRIRLETKGVRFGSIVCDASGECDTSQIEGIAPDLVVRPFGRKGSFITVRAFDVGAMQFHHGIQPTETVGEGVDADGDGVADELTVGEMSALSIFLTTLERPEQRGDGPSGKLSREARRGKRVFKKIGCADCHVPSLRTRNRNLPLSFPEIPEDPGFNVYYEVDLTAHPTSFQRAGRGLRVPLYADLKLHEMGSELAESTGDPLDAWFTTARLWGIADTAPYMHDGRATTLSGAILMHGGEAQDSRDAFEALSRARQDALIAFLRTLRTPRKVGEDLDVYDLFNRR